MAGIFSDLIGTTLERFRIGLRGIFIKNENNSAVIRNPADNADAPLIASTLTASEGEVRFGNTVFEDTAGSALTIQFPSKSVDGYLLSQKANTPPNILAFELVAVSGAGGDAGYNHIQSTASAVWSINHGLGFQPNIQTFDLLGQEVIGDVIQHSPTAASVVFAYPLSGAARCA